MNNLQKPGAQIYWLASDMKFSSDQFHWAVNISGMLHLICHFLWPKCVCPAHLEKSSGIISYQSIQSLLWPSIHSFLPSQWCQPPHIDFDPHHRRIFSLSRNQWADPLDPLSSATYSSHHRHRPLALHQALREMDCLEESYRASHLYCYHPHQSEALFLTMLIWNIFA